MYLAEYLQAEVNNGNKQQQKLIIKHL